ncbi:hypothetical protein [Nitrobacter sp. JJSN]|uniref:hypothetical protein n=1 Tax=Nitrobacter sp. JJSN TaxID=3453033 RepID=UPI003F77553A
MPSLPDAWLCHQQSRWLRPDAALWVRPDAAQFLQPGVDVVKAFPALARKYNPDQPRVPAGSSDGGQWTDGGGSHPAAQERGLIQLAGDPPPGMGHNQGPPLDEPPGIPSERPLTSAQRTAFLRAAASWLARHPGLAGEIYTGTMNNVEWLKDYHDLIQAARDDRKHSRSYKPTLA